VSRWIADHWRDVLDAATALGTVGAVIVALWTAHRGRESAEQLAANDRRAADRRAEDDRRTFAEQQRQEREHDRLTANARWRLELLLRIAEAYERQRALIAASLPAGEAQAVLVSLLYAYPGPLRVLRSAYIRPQRPEDDVLGALGLELCKLYGVSHIPSEEANRAELIYRLAEIRRELQLDPPIDPE
jgi:hypothetical protein